MTCFFQLQLDAATMYRQLRRLRQAADSLLRSARLSSQRAGLPRLLSLHYHTRGRLRFTPMCKRCHIPSYQLAGRGARFLQAERRAASRAAPWLPIPPDAFSIGAPAFRAAMLRVLLCRRRRSSRQPSAYRGQRAQRLFSATRCRPTRQDSITSLRAMMRLTTPMKRSRFGRFAISATIAGSFAITSRRAVLGEPAT